MFGNGSQNKTVATARDNGIAIGEMGNDNFVAQNQNFYIFMQNPISPEAFELFDHGKKVSSKIDLQIDKVKELINSGQVQKALERIQEIEDIWSDDLTKYHRFRLETDRGIIFSIQGDYHSAANKFIEAFDLEQNEITYANKILAYTLLKDNTKLNQIIAEAQKAFPNSKAITSQIIRTYINDSSVKDLHNLDDIIFTDALCCLMASSFYAERNDLKNALIMAQKANEIKLNDWQIMANLGCYLISDIFLNRVNYSLLTDEQFKNMQQAQSLFEASWNIVKDSEYPFDFISYIPINLFSLYGLQQNKEKVDELLNILCDKLPNNPNIVFHKIMRNLDTISDDELLKLQPHLYNDHAKLLADIYINNGEYEKALKYISQAPEKDDIFIITMKMQCLWHLHNDEKMAKMKKQYKDKTIKAILKFIETNNPDILLKVKDSAKRDDLKLYIAQSLYGYSRYRDASDIFQSVIKHKDLRDYVYRQYLDCLARTNNFVELKKQLSGFSIDSMDDWAVCLLGCAYAGISDFYEAEKLFKILYEKHRDNANYICNLLITLIKLHEKSKVIDILNNINIDIHKLQGDIKYKYSIISYINNYIDQEKALEQIYLLTVYNMAEVEAWNQYFIFMIENHIERNNKTAYLLQDLASQSIKCIFIDDNTELKTKYFDIMTTQNPLAKILLSHQQNDIVNLTPSVKVLIKDINDKYTILLEIISKNIFLEFPTNKQIERITASSPEELFSYLQTISEDQKKRWSVCQEIYDNGFPITLLAGMINKDVFSVLETLQLSHLNIARGTVHEVDNAVKLCTNHDKYIIDTITLYNIFTFQLQNILSSLKNKIYIAQSTKNKFISIIEKIKESVKLQTSRLQTDAETGKMYMLNSEQLKDVANIELQRFDEILKWIQDNAVIVKAKYETEFEKEQTKILSALSEFDDEVSEIVNIATERNLILVSDDLHLRDFVQTFNIRNIWTQVILKVQQVSANTYNAFLKASVFRHHTFISLTAHDLIYCLKNDSTSDLKEFKELAYGLGKASSDSAALVIQETLVYICSQYPKYAKLFVYNIIINAYLQNGTSLDFEERLKNLHIIGNIYSNFHKALYLWEQGHFVVHF